MEKKTAVQALEQNNIHVERLREEKPMLMNSILKSIEEYAIQYIDLYNEATKQNELLQEEIQNRISQFSKGRGVEFAESLRYSLTQSIKDAEALGREGCTYGDTKYDSLSAHYGEKIAYEGILQDVNKFLKEHHIAEENKVKEILYRKVEIDCVDCKRFMRRCLICNGRKKIIKYKAVGLNK